MKNQRTISEFMEKSDPKILSPREEHESLNQKNIELDDGDKHKSDSVEIIGESSAAEIADTNVEIENVVDEENGLENTIAYKKLEPFQFLYNIKGLPDDVNEKCNTLETLLKQGDEKDIDGVELSVELKLLTRKLPDIIHPEDILEWILSNELEEIFPNVKTAIQILLTLPVSVAKGERSFSKLKLIKTYLRSSMSQERLNGLAIISIENSMAQSLNLDELRREFAKLKARKAPISLT